MNRLFIQPETSAEGEFYIKRAFYCPEKEPVKVCNGETTVAAVEVRQDEKGNVSFFIYESLQDAEKRESSFSAESLLRKEASFSKISDEETEKVAEIFGKLSAALSYGYTMYSDILENKTENAILNDFAVISALHKTAREIGSFVRNIDTPNAFFLSENFMVGFDKERLRCEKENYAAGLEAEYLYHDNEEEPER